MRFLLLVVTALVAINYAQDIPEFRNGCSDYSRVSGIDSQSMMDAMALYYGSMIGAYGSGSLTPEVYTGFADAYETTCLSVCNTKVFRFPGKFDMPGCDPPACPYVNYNAAVCVPDVDDCTIEEYLDKYLYAHNIVNTTTEVDEISSGVSTCVDDSNSICFDFTTEFQDEVQEVNLDYLICLGVALLGDGLLTAEEADGCIGLELPRCLSIENARLYFFDDVADVLYPTLETKPIGANISAGFCSVEECESGPETDTNLKYQLGANAGIWEALARNGAYFGNWDVTFESRGLTAPPEEEETTASGAIGITGSLVTLVVSWLAFKL